jgi:hypothetical protein
VGRGGERRIDHAGDRRRSLHGAARSRRRRGRSAEIRLMLEREPFPRQQARSTAQSRRAITFGTVDTTNRFPYVGAVIAEYNEPGTKEVLCSGTLISPTVFLTAGHCTAFLESIDVQDVWVTFDPSFDAASPLIRVSSRLVGEAAA